MPQQSLQSWWWPNDPASSYMAQATEEYDNTLTTVTIYATITERQLDSIKIAFTDLTLERTQNNAIRIHGYDRQVLYGTSLLSAFRQYDRTARLAK